MRNYSIRKDGDNLHIDEFPEAVKIIRVDNILAKRLADLSLHKIDLDFASQCLEKIKSQPLKISDLEEIYWRSSIIFFIKCFGSSKARFSLNEKVIYKNEPSLALVNFKYFKNLRNKHLIHDENSYAQALPGAVLNKPDNPVKIEKIVSISFIPRTLSKNDLGNLSLLIKIARKYVDDQGDKICEKLTADLEAKTYSELSKMDEIIYTAPTIDDISKNRKTRP